MSQLPTSIGDAEVQKRFIESHKSFLMEFPELQKLLETAFDKAQVVVSDHSSQTTGLPRTDESIARPVIYSLELAAYDDFGELLILAGNGMGFGAMKTLRSMYERLVTAMYIAKKPSEAQVFIDHGAIEKGKLINRYKNVAPELLAEDTTREELEGIEKRFSEAKAREKEDFCKTCGHAITKEAWTRKSLDDMARQVDDDLLKAYATCYLEPTFLAHATPTGLDFRVRFTDSGPEFKELSEPEADGALMRGHSLILGVLNHLNTYFNLGLSSEVGSRFEAFGLIWAKSSL
jgi:hypothetical protein